MLRIITGLSTEPDAAMTQMKAIHASSVEKKEARAFLYVDYYEAMMFDSNSAVQKALFSDPQILELSDAEKKKLLAAYNCVDLLVKCCKHVTHSQNSLKTIKISLIKRLGLQGFTSLVAQESFGMSNTTKEMMLIFTRYTPEQILQVQKVQHKVCDLILHLFPIDQDKGLTSSEFKEKYLPVIQTAELMPYMSIDKTLNEEQKKEQKVLMIKALVRMQEI